MKEDEFFIRKAMEQALIAQEMGEVPVGAVIVHSQRIIAKGYNLTQRLNDVTAHAEIQAITAASEFLGGKYLKDCTLYVTLEPCVMCAGAIFWSQISRVVFSARDFKRGFLQSGVKLHPKTSLTMGILEEENTEIIKNFFQKKR